MAPFTASAAPEELPYSPVQESQTLPELFVENRLVSVVACVLSIPPQSISLIDSFIELGGDEQSAYALRSLCMSIGFELSIDDIMQCPTLAELQTRITPVEEVAPNVDYRTQHSYDYGCSPSVDATAIAQSKHLSPETTPAATERETLEQLILEVPDVSGVVVVQPKAGPLEGQRIVFVTLASSASTGPHNLSGTHVVLQSHMYHAGREMATIRFSLETLRRHVTMPETWIILDQLPTNPEGQPDRRILQTWTQNMNENMYKQVKSLETEQILQEPVTDIRRTTQEVVTPTNAFKLSPMQQLYFDTATGGRLDLRDADDGTYRFNRSVLLKVNGNFALDDIQAAVQMLACHHPMLRARFTACDDSWTQYILPEVDGSYGFGHHTVDSIEDISSVVEQAQQVIDIERGPVFAVEYFRMGDGQQMLFLVAHQLVADHISWGILLRDCDELLSTGTLSSQQSMPFLEWNKLQEEDAERTGTSSSPLPFQPHPCDLASWGLGESLNTYSECSEASFTISSELTTILHTTCADVFRAEPADIYIAALHLAFAQTFNDRPLPTIWNQEHGRNPWNADMHVAETVGWLAALCPVSLRATPAGEADLLHMIRDVKDTRRAIPNRGCQYFASRFFGPLAETRCAEGWPFEIMFTYLESGADSISASPSGGSALEAVKLPGQEIHSRCGNVGSQVTRLALFEIEISVERGAATVKIVFNRASEQQKEIENWILAYEHLLYEAVGRMRYRAQELTLADIPLLRTDHQGLEKLNSKHIRALGLPSAQNIEDVLPASRTQEEVLCCSHFPSGCDNHTICALTFKGDNEVDHTHICSVWEQIVARHPALRTVFVDSVREDGLFDQVVLKRCSSDMLFFEPAPEADPVESLRALPTMPTIPGQPRHRLSICTSSIGAFMKIEASQAICDMSSLQLLVSELRRKYNSAKIPMNVLSSSHKSCLQHVLSTGRPDTNQYWQASLRNVEPCHFPGTEMTKAIRNLHNHIDLDVSSSSVDDFCRKFSVNRGTLMLVAWGLVLRVFTNTNNVCFGFRTSARESANAPRDMQHSIGCYDNIVPVHMDLSATGSLEAAVHAAAEKFAHCLPHQHISLAEVEHAIGLRGEKLFNTCVSLIESPTYLKSRFSSNRPQVETSCLGLSGNTENGTIALTVMFINGYLACDIAHPGLSQKQVSSIIYAFGEAINSIISNPFASLDSLNLSAQDNVALHGSGRPDVPEPCLHSLFINQARRTPEAAAVTAADGDLSYQSIARLVQRLAALLSERGVRPGVPVVAILGRSMWSVVSILAILKAGGCFVPVDGEDRHMVEAVIKEVRPRLTLVTENVSPDLNLPFDGLILVNDSLFTGRLGLDAPTRRASGDDVACILFPAGSSRSKELRGFMYSHVALSSAFLAQGEPLGLNGESRVLQISSFSVDTSLVETLATLVHGGCVCIPSPAERKSDMAGAVRRMQANWTYMTPIVARRFRPSAMPSLKSICFRTRGLDEDTCAPWMRRVRVLLAYGCLEVCPLGISVLEVTRREHLGRIAQPFLGRCWVASADDPSRLLPEGAIGELCIESPTIAHRYVAGAPIKPLVQFDDHASQAGQKMIRFIKTSQSVRWVEDGTLELVLNPRRDLAINGRPVSAVEVEMQLRRCLDSDLDVAVETVTSQDGKQLLAAFVQLDKTWQGPEDPARLEPCMKERAYFARHFAQNSLGETLPKHSIPSAFIPVRRLPVTSAMKVNRRKLQRWVRHISEQDTLAISRGGAARLSGMLKPLPLTKIEERMRSIWSDLLQVHESAIEPGAGFMTLGGGKFLARALVIRCREQGLEISIGDVLRGASLTQLCQGITLESDASFAKEPESGNQASTASACARADEGVIKASVASQLGINRGDILDLSEASALQIRATELGLLRGKGGFSHLVLSFSNLASATQLEAACFGLCVIHPILRTALVRSGRQMYQVAARSWSPGFQRVSCPAFRLGALVDKAIKKDATNAAPLATLLTKFSYFDAGKQSMLVLRMTRAQYDEVSIPLLVKDLAQLYAGQRAPAGRSTYFDHVRSVQMACDGTGMEYWQGLMQGAVMTRVFDWTGPPSIPVAVQRLQRQITTVDLSGLDATFDTVLKAAWALVLATLSGRGDVLFGEVVEGRHLRLTKGNSPMGVAGPMQNTIPIRVSFGERQGTPLELLQIIQDQKTSSQAYENAAWADIVKSTAMPWWTRFSTAVHHRSHSGDAQEVRFNDAACHFSIREPQPQLDHDILITTSAVDSCKVDISLSYCDTHVPQAFANEALDLLCAAIDLLTSASMTHPVLPSASDLQSIQPRLPLPEALQTVTTSQESRLPTTQQVALQSLVNKAWTRAVSPEESGVPESHLHNAAFYDICGGLIPAAEIADRITRGLPRLRIPGANEVKISTEEVVCHPTMAAQIDLLTRKILNPETPKRRLTGSFIPGSSAYLGRSIRRLATHARSHSRSASEGSSRSSPIAASPPRTIFDEHAASPRVSNAGTSNPSPSHDIITEKHEEQVETKSPPSEATKNGKRPALTLLVHGNNSGGSGSQGSMESLTTGTTGSEDEVGDVLGPLEWTPAVGRYSPAAGEELGMVSPLSPVDKPSMAVGAGGDAAGLGVQGLGPTSPVASTRRKRASSVFSRMGFSSPV